MEDRDKENRMGLRNRMTGTVIAAVALAVGALQGPAQAAAFIDWDIYHNYSSLLSYTCGPNTKSSVPLRYGSTGAGGLGLYHIEEGHGDFTSQDKSNVGQTLMYGRIEFQTNQHIYRLSLGGQGTWRVVVSTRCDSPQDYSINGIITAFRE